MSADQLNTEAHLDLLTFLLVRNGSGCNHVFLKQFSFLLQFPGFLFLVLLKLGKLLGSGLLKFQTVLSKKENQTRTFIVAIQSYLSCDEKMSSAAGNVT